MNWLQERIPSEIITYMTNSFMTPFDTFLSDIRGGREVALIIVEDEKQLKSVQKTLADTGWSVAFAPLDLMDVLKTGGKYALVVQQENAKDAYDFAIQYPTGHVSLFDEKMHDYVGASPVYNETAIAYLIMETDLTELERESLVFREKVGITWRHPSL